MCLERDQNDKIIIMSVVSIMHSTAGPLLFTTIDEIVVLTAGLVGVIFKHESVPYPVGWVAQW